jgi:hypothetical protein
MVCRKQGSADAGEGSPNAGDRRLGEALDAALPESLSAAASASTLAQAVAPATLFGGSDAPPPLDGVAHLHRDAPAD